MIGKNLPCRCWEDGSLGMMATRLCLKDVSAKTGQVIIQVRDVQGASGGDGQDDNPFDWEAVCKNIEDGLAKDNFHRGQEYEIMLVPNIVNITYGRGVGYKFEEEVFEEAITDISATKIRKEMRDKGTL